MTQFTLLSRSYCHLCDEMQAAVGPVARKHALRLVVVDVDADPALEAAHGDRVPVLFLGTPADGVELCHFHFDAAAVDRALGFPAGLPGTC